MRIVIAGVSSGTGKTSMTAGIVGALRRRGLKVQPFKAGPDYIDPSYHTLAAGLPSRNLDSWMLGAPALRELFEHATAHADIAVIEGVMGLYDGKSGRDSGGSTADLAKLLDAPVLLVVDVRGMARSAAALVLGYQRFDAGVQLAGVLLNNVGSPAHARWVREAVEDATGLPVVGYLPRRPDLELPERHLGLVPVAERPAPTADVLAALATQVEQTVDLDALLRVASSCGTLLSNAGAQPEDACAPRGRQFRAAGNLFPPQRLDATVTIALASDEAFSFYYQDNLDLLAAWGARLVPFSPLRDERLPEDAAGIYVGGGFPEVYAGELAANAAMRRALTHAISSGMPLYAECGGLMYLGQGIVDFEGRRHEMVGVLGGWATMRERKMALGYRTVRARRDSFLLRVGEVVRGHEFHWSSLDQVVDPDEAAYDVLDDAAHASSPGGVVSDLRRVEGYLHGNLLASYVHLHFGAKPELAPRFVAACVSWREWGV